MYTFLISSYPMIIDLHNHTSRYSPCSNISPELLIKTYIDAGVDAVCITEHDCLWQINEQIELQAKYKGLIKIFFGIEASFDIGHVLIFCKNQKIPLNRFIDNYNNNPKSNNDFALIWAHPFRWGFGRGDIYKVDYFSKFDAVEYLNGNLTHEETMITKLHLFGKGIKLTGGSDTHSTSMAAKSATAFDSEINTIEELVDNIKTGKYKPIVLTH